MADCKTAGKGLQLVFWGTVIAALGNLRSINAILGGIAAIAGAILVLYGLYTAIPAHPYYRFAMCAQCVGLLVSALRMLPVISDIKLLSALLSILGTLIALLSTGLVCTATGELLKSKSDLTLAGRAKIIILLYALCAAVSIVLGWLPILGGVIEAITALVMLVAQVLEVIFYYQASKSLLG